MGSPSDFIGVTYTLSRETIIGIVVACIGVTLIPL